MDFLLKSSGLIILLFLFYTVFLQNETYFKSIRHYFLIGLIIAILIPLIEIPIYVEAIASEINNYKLLQIENNVIEIKAFNWNKALGLVYIIGVLFFSFKFLFQLISLIRLISKHTLKKQNKYYFIETSNNSSPFSFFNFIIYNKSQFTRDELTLIINHEKAHAVQWHSIDTILTHLLVIALWFNPFVWLYKKAVQQNLEFLADKFALELAENKKQYQLTLLKTCNKNFCTAITNNFYNSLIKKRIIMLQKNQNQNKRQWKFALLIPLLIAFIAIFSTKTVAQEKKLSEISTINKLKVELKIDKNSTDATLKDETAFFKKQFDADISFKSIKRNTKNEITAIKITSKYKSNSVVFSRKSSEPINPVIISYDSEIDEINITSFIEEEEIHKDIHYTNRANNLIFKKKSDTTVNFKTHNLKGKNSIGFSKNVNDTIIVNGNKIIWHKDDDNHLELEVEEIEENILYEPVDASEHVYIIKSDDAKDKKYKVIRTKNKVAFKSDNEEPLYILNKKEISSEEMKLLDPKTIESVTVLKDESATKVYGEKGKNGVIVITLKKD
jgi:TonB-dependent SusC/RagA subfamily outer membrane receptor